MGDAEYVDVGDRERSVQLLEQLRCHFVAPDDPFGGRTFLTEVTAPHSTRRADAVWVGLYQSRGYGIDVCELKVSRSDFEREISKPAKAEAWWSYSNRFWIVAPDVDVAPPDRLPEGWGLMVPKKRGRRFQVVVPPAERDPVIDLELLVRLVVRLNSSFDRVISEQRTAHRDEVAELRRRHHESLEEAGAGYEARSRLEALEEFEAAAGIRIEHHSWRGALSGASAGRSFAEYAQAREERERLERRMQNHTAAITRAAAALAADAERLATAARLGPVEGDDGP